MEIDLYLSAATHGSGQGLSNELVDLVHRGVSLKVACEERNTSVSTWYRRRMEGSRPDGRIEMQWFALRLAAAEVGAARKRLMDLAMVLEVDADAFPQLAGLQELVRDEELC